MRVLRLTRPVAWLLWLLLGAVLGLLWPVLNRPPLVLNQDAAVSGVALNGVRAELDPAGFLDVRPLSAPASTLLILYGGGLVRPQAYQWIGTALAPQGVRTVIPVFPLDLAVFSPNRAETILSTLRARGELPPKVFLAGHSLGGAMAARFARGHAQELAGLALMGAYSAGGDDLSGLELPTLVLAGERDEVASLSEVRAGLARLPKGANLVVVPGSVHAFFGRYGPQRGDGTPTTIRAEAEARIAAELADFVR